MFDLTAPLSRKDAAYIASRALTVFFLVWLVSELIALTPDIYSVHYFTGLVSRGGTSYDSYLRSQAVQFLCSHIIRAALAFLAAGWTYRCGAGVIRFLLPDAEERKL